jgi:hypothetical protein
MPTSKPSRSSPSSHRVLNSKRQLPHEEASVCRHGGDGSLDALPRRPERHRSPALGDLGNRYPAFVLERPNGLVPQRFIGPCSCVRDGLAHAHRMTATALASRQAPSSVAVRRRERPFTAHLGSVPGRSRRSNARSLLTNRSTPRGRAGRPPPGEAATRSSSPSRAGSPRTRPRGSGTRSRTRAWPTPRRAPRRCSARRGRRPTGSASAARPAGRSPRARAAARAR